MRGVEFAGEIEKKKKILAATDADIRRVTGWSASTYRRRMAEPESITLGEASKIGSYLGIKVRIL